MNTAFWHGRRVFLTGHTGFKGSWLSLWLQSLGAHVSGFALHPPTTPNLFDLAQVADGMISQIGDIRNFNVLQSSLAASAAEIVIHMAAQPLVRYSYTAPIETYATNVMGTVHLLEAVRNVKSVRAVVVVTSDKSYENREWLWGYRENEAMGGFDPYSSSKGCAELVTAAYRQSYFSPNEYGEAITLVGSARAGNVIGGGDWAKDRLIPDMMRAFSEEQPVIIRNPNAVRPWQHVMEPLAGYLMLAEALYYGNTDFAGGWNFGPPDTDAKEVRWIVERLVNLWGSNASWKLDVNWQPHEARHLKLDCSKAQGLLGWKPRWSLETALERVVEWHQAMQAGRDLKKISLLQIEDYQNV
jgi:CDP-glucose 4,6-dehydratase